MAGYRKGEQAVFFLGAASNVVYYQRDAPKRSFIAHNHYVRAISGQHAGDYVAGFVVVVG